MKVFVLDGPWVGKVVDVPGWQFLVSSPFETVPWEPPPAPWEPLPEPTLYYVHRAAMFGRTVCVASTNPGPVDPAVGFKYLVSAKAKRAVQK